MHFRKVARAAFNRLPFHIRYELFYQAGRSLGIPCYGVRGELGTFIGGFGDQTIMKGYLRERMYAPRIIHILREFFGGRGGEFYDIGANIGLISIAMARDPNVRVTAFEPDPDNFSFLKANIAMSAVKVDAFNLAVSSRKGKARFSKSQYNFGDHRLSEHGDIEVDTVTLDDFCAPGHRYAVKIDAQGAEPLIVSGGARFLAGASLIVAEFWPWGMSKLGGDPNVVIDFAGRAFPAGYVVSGAGTPPGPRPISEVISSLKGMLGQEHEREDRSVDVVLTRQDG